MVKAQSNGNLETAYETLFDLTEYDDCPDFAQDDYETPDGSYNCQKLAQVFAGLANVAPGHKILDCSAGSGRVAQFLNPGATCIEINPDRVAQGKTRAPRCNWVQADFLTLENEAKRKYKVIITNPPFSLGMAFIDRSRLWLEPGGYLLFLLPLCYFSTVERADRAAAMGLVRLHTYEIKGRVAYLRGNAPIKGRQVEDAIHKIGFDRRFKPTVTTLSI